MVCSFMQHQTVGIVPQLPTTRALMQVSYQARRAVLAGREMVKCEGNVLKAFLGGLFPSASITQDWTPKFHNYFFVDWEIDMFYFRGAVNVSTFLDQTSMYAIKRIAIDIEGPEDVDEDLLTAPEYDRDLFMESTIQDLSMLASLELLYLVLDYNFVRGMYSSRQRAIAAADEDGDDEDDDDDSETDEFEDDQGYDSEGNSIDGDGDDASEEDPEQDEDDGTASEFLDYDSDHIEWLCELGTERYGFHPVKRESDRHFQTTPTSVFEVRDRGTDDPIPFQEWAQKIMYWARLEAQCFCELPVDIHMVMDPLGGDDTGLIHAYYRESVGYQLLDEPSS